MSSEKTTVELDASIVSTSRQRRAWAIAPRLAASVIETFPIAPDTASGRVKARRIKIFLISAGLFTLLAGHQYGVVIGLGVLVMSFAIFLPMGDLQKRSLLRRLKVAQYEQIRTTRPARLLHDGRRLVFFDGEKRDRRVLTNKPFKLELRASKAGGVWVGVIPRDSSKKRDAIWFRADSLTTSSALDVVDMARIDPVIVVEGSADELLAQLEADAMKVNK